VALTTSRRPSAFPTGGFSNGIAVLLPVLWLEHNTRNLSMQRHNTKLFVDHIQAGECRSNDMISMDGNNNGCVGLTGRYDTTRASVITLEAGKGQNGHSGIAYERCAALAQASRNAARDANA
jgi:hypothetical protein